MKRTEFFDLQPLAIFGVSSRSKNFGAAAFKDLTGLGIKCFALNPKGGKVGDQEIYPSLTALPEKARGAVILTKGEGAGAAVEECSRENLEWVWLQGGSDTPEMRRLCTELGIKALIGQCILMRQGKFPHSLHRFIHDLFSPKSRKESA
jgi:predicted CoA-binding protein